MEFYEEETDFDFTFEDLEPSPNECVSNHHQVESNLHSLESTQPPTIRPSINMQSVSSPQINYSGPLSESLSQILQANQCTSHSLSTLLLAALPEYAIEQLRSKGQTINSDDVLSYSTNLLKSCQANTKTEISHVERAALTHQAMNEQQFKQNLALLGFICQTPKIELKNMTANGEMSTPLISSSTTETCHESDFEVDDDDFNFEDDINISEDGSIDQSSGLSSIQIEQCGLLVDSFASLPDRSSFIHTYLTETTSL